MQQHHRSELLAAITAAVEELYAAPGDARTAAALRARLAPLLDGLLPVQPITDAEVTILLADIRGYTALSQQTPPATMAALLNRWFATMCRIISVHGGLVDKFMGDSVMALFGVPTPRPDDLARALACAAAIQQAMVSFNQGNEQQGLPPLYVGVAMNTGQVMAGHFGSAEHSEYTVVGDAVNLAARIEPFSLRGQVLLSASSYSAAGDLAEVGTVNQVWVKGLSTPVTLYEMLSVRGPHPLVVPRGEPRRSPRIIVDLPAAFRPLRSKIILPQPIIGRVIDLSYHGMRAHLPTDLPLLSEVVIDLDGDGDGEDVGDVYARVLRAQPGRNGYITCLELTALGSPGQRLIKQMVDEGLWRR